MNIILFEREELTTPLSLSDERAKHIIRVLKKGAGDEVKAGVVDGEEGAALIETVDEKGIHFTFRATGEGKKPLDIVMLMASVRPIQARRLVKALASIGVKKLLFTPTGKGEKSYLHSTFYREESSEMRKAIMEGAWQAGATHLMRSEVFSSFREAISHATALTEGLADASKDKAGEGMKKPFLKIALDNVRPMESFHALLTSELSAGKRGVCIAVGGERGWVESEREEFTRRGFTLCSFGSRILTAETAAIGSACTAMSFISY